jgi:hypothetical protein
VDRTLQRALRLLVSFRMFKTRVELCLGSLVMAGAMGCGGGTNLYGPKSCEPDADKLAAYPTANGNAAVCIARERVEFMLCTRELGLSNVLVEKANSTNLTAAVPDAGDAKAGVDLRSQEKQASYWAQEGELAKARADMIRACVNMLPAEIRPATQSAAPTTSASSAAPSPPTP